MSKNHFSVTYEIVTPESAEQGEAEETGYICKGTNLREAFQAVYGTRTNRVDGINAIEANDSDTSRAHWVSICNGMEFETGAHETRSIHFPDSLTAATRKRICSFLCAK